MRQSHKSIDFAIGIDGGGSKTLAVVVDAHGREVGRGLAGSANYIAVGLTQAVRNIYAAAEEAARNADCHLPLDAAWLGLAGLDRPDDHRLLLPHMDTLAKVVCLVNDGELLLSGLDNAVGVALISGTGSIALGCSAGGSVVRAGGWGHVLGDEGSGYEIGRLGLQAAVRAADGRGPATVLLERILQYWQIEDPSDIIGRTYTGHDEKAKIASLSKLIFAAARSGDRVALDIVQHAVDELALAVVTVATKLGFAEHGIPLALGGGLLVNEVDFRAQVLASIARQRKLGQVAIVEEPASTAARAALTLDQPT
ncbi:MAG TPA: BadF/BadG/BcrA/BcrD ATPase family protein [Ktedonosporobacter sp.]|nr:BadF/BadG/BcrA/BcrD ATPase family protein [Ktedonosporobacter sp.]